MSAIQQDWEPVVLRKSGARPASAKVVARGPVEPGAAVETVKKYNAGANKQHAGSGIYAPKLDENGEGFELPKVSRGLADSIRDARAKKNWTQKQLAQAICEQEHVVKDLESAKGVPNNAVIAKMERALGVKLPRAPKK
eukprot:tig00021072_g17993.t1